MNAFADSFANMMPENIVLTKWLGTYDGEGQPQYSDTSVLLKCRIEEKVRTVKDQTGEERVSTTTLYVLVDAPIGPYDQITMPDSYQGSSNPPILSTANQHDETGFCGLSEVYL